MRSCPALLKPSRGLHPTQSERQSPAGSGRPQTLWFPPATLPSTCFPDTAASLCALNATEPLYLLSCLECFLETSTWLHPHVPSISVQMLPPHIPILCCAFQSSDHPGHDVFHFSVGGRVWDESSKKEGILFSSVGAPQMHGEEMENRYCLPAFLVLCSKSI